MHQTDESGTGYGMLGGALRGAAYGTALGGLTGLGLGAAAGQLGDAVEGGATLGLYGGALAGGLAGALGWGRHAPYADGSLAAQQNLGLHATPPKTAQEAPTKTLEQRYYDWRETLPRATPALANKVQKAYSFVTSAAPYSPPRLLNQAGPKLEQAGKSVGAAFNSLKGRLGLGAPTPPATP